MDNTVSEWSNKIFKFFEKIVPELGRTTGFVQRHSKLDALVFVKTMVFGFMNNPKASLEHLCALSARQGVTITKQGLHARLHDKTVELMKGLFEHSTRFLRTDNQEVSGLFNRFSRIEMLDSTGISLPKTLAKCFPGYGGSASASGLKIQLMLDYLKGHMTHTAVTGARINDQSYQGHLPHLQSGALYLQDLGYFCLSRFEQISQSDAYFISRLLKTTQVFYQGVELNLSKWLGSCTGDLIEIAVTIGKHAQLPVRLIMRRVPPSVAEKRRREARRVAKKKGRTLSQSSLDLMAWSIYITNVEQEISTEQVILLYGARWQIELFFKLCKSDAGIDKLSGYQRPRILCELYAKLIAIVLLLYLSGALRWQQAREISWHKAFNYLKSVAIDFNNALISRYRLKQVISRLWCNWKQFAFKDKYRHNRPSTAQLLMMADGLSE